MTKKIKEMKNLDIELLEEVSLQIYELKYKVEWKNDYKAKIYKDKTLIGTMTLKDRDMSIEGEKLIKLIEKLVKRYKEHKENPVSDNDISNSPLKDILNNDDATYGNIRQNSTVFKKLVDKLNKIGIKDFLAYNSLNHSNSMKEGLTICFSPSISGSDRKNFEEGYTERLKTLLETNIKSYRGENSTITSSSSGYLKILPDEKVTELKMFGEIIGKYYEERNLVLININMFKLNKISHIDTTIPEEIEMMLDYLVSSGLKKRELGDLAKKIFVEKFLTGSRERLERADSNMRSYQSNISSYEDKIVDFFEKYNEELQTKEHLTNIIKDSGKTLFKEIDKIKELPFVEDLNMDSGELKVTFKEACLPLQNFDRGSNLKKFGKRTIYLGKITFTISPQGFKVNNTDNFEGHSHSHASGINGTPCFGDGDGRRKINQLLTDIKLAELCKMLWFWIKTHRDSGAYIKQYYLYDDRLKKGLPVWDEKGNLITINDKERIKAGEQIELEKSSVYKDNIKRFKNITKPF